MSQPQLPQISATQRQKEVIVDENFTVLAPAAQFGRKYTTTQSLTWGYYGGLLPVDGVITSIADGTINLVPSAINYIEMDRAGLVGANVTGFTPGKYPLYTATTDGAGITGYIDYRMLPMRFVGRLYKDLSGLNGPVSLTVDEARCELLEFYGTPSGAVQIVVPAIRQEWVVYNTVTAWPVSFKTATAIEVTVGADKHAIVATDGTDIVRVTPDT